MTLGISAKFPAVIDFEVQSQSGPFVSITVFAFEPESKWAGNDLEHRVYNVSINRKKLQLDEGE